MSTDEYVEDIDEDEMEEVEAVETNSLDSVKTRALQALSAIVNPNVHALDVHGLYLWSTAEGPIWYLCILGEDPSPLGKIVVNNGTCAITPGTFRNPLAEGHEKAVRNHPKMADMVESALGSLYMREDYVIQMIRETKFRDKVVILPSDKDLEKYRPPRVFTGLFSKAFNQIFPPDVTLVNVRLTVLETGEIAEGQLPEKVVRDLGLPESE